jgi:hypothetical protein
MALLVVALVRGAASTTGICTPSPGTGNSIGCPAASASGESGRRALESDLPLQSQCPARQGCWHMQCGQPAAAWYRPRPAR